MKALIAMSGGVDSSAAALLLREAGMTPVGGMMRLYPKNPTAEADARAVAMRLGIDFHIFDYADFFREKIIGGFQAAYRQGRTPNPCVECNRLLKFGKLAEEADRLGCQYLATGHYARIEQSGSRWYLKRARDAKKDQSYVLYSLTEELLPRILFPLGELTKEEVRAYAAAAGFQNAGKQDSQDICFIPDGDYVAFLESTGGEAAPGDFTDREGNFLGRHRGLLRYTVGQHKKLGLSTPEPLYVTALVPEENRVILGRSEELFSREVFLPHLHWISSDPPPACFSCRVKIRYRQAEQPAKVYVSGESARLLFCEPQRAVTPGQSAVLYDGDTVLGGGIIAPLPD